MGDNTCSVLIIIIVIVLVILFISNNQKVKEQTENKSSLQNQLKDNNFKSDKTFDINSLGINIQVAFDLDNKKIAILDALANNIEYVEFNKIIDCEIIEDNTTIMKSGIGRAIVGGVLAGGIGAIVGSNTRGSSAVVKNLAIRIITNDISKALVMITLIKLETKRDSDTYKKCMTDAQEMYSTIISILNSNRKDTQANVDLIGSKSISDQIRELAKLKEEGLITEVEFNKKKKQLLNMN